MEENLHEDKMDDYVRKSFEEYEETPSPDMWDRVATDLDDTIVRPPLWVSFRRLGWPLLAAGIILVLTTTMVCEHLYYEAQIEALTQTVNPVDPITTHIQDKAVANHSDKAQTTTTSAQDATASIPQTLAVKEPVKRKENQERTHESITIPSGPITPEYNQPSPETALTTTNTQVVAPAQESPTSNPDVLELQTIPVPLAGLEKPASVYPVLPSITVPVKALIKPAQQTSGWYASVETSILNRTEKAHTLPSRPGRPTFTAENTGAQTTSIYWIKAGKQWRNHWSLESGIGYQDWRRTGVHHPKFRFGDGTHLGMRRNFVYDLNTSSGTAEVNLRMEQTQPGVPSDDEPVNLRIETTESAQWLRIPLLAGYHWGKARWKGFVQTGLLANVVVQNRLNIAARVSENARFKPVDGQDGYTITFTQKRFVPGYWMGAGAGYQLGQHLQIQAEACLSGDFPGNDVYRRRLPERYLAGVNLGLSYYF